MPETTTTETTTTTAPETGPDGAGTPAVDVDGETFPRAYVEQLRAEAAEHRVKAKRADDLAARLLAATIREATAGVLADPTDLPETGDYLDDDDMPDPERIRAAAVELVERKPHLADRRPRGDIGQGATTATDTVNLASLLRVRAT